MQSIPREYSISTSSQDIGHWLDECALALSNSAWRELVDVDDVHALDLVYSLLLYQLIHRRLDHSENAQRPRTPGKPNFIKSLRLRSSIKEALDIYKRGRAHPFMCNDSVVFMPSEPTHLKVQFPLVSELSLLNRNAHFAVWDAHTYDGVCALGARPFLIHDERYWLDSFRDREIRREMDACGVMDLPDARFECDSEGMKSFVEDYLKRSLPRLRRLQANTRDFISTLAPGTVVVVGYDLTPQGRLAAIYARRRGLPTAVIEHGFPPLGVLAKRQVSDRIIVYGDHGRSHREKFGVDPSRIYVCGCSGFDYRPTQTKEIDESIATKYGLSPKKKWMLVATSGAGGTISESHHKLVIEGLFRLSREIDDVDFVVKLHRKDKISYYDAAASRFPDHRLKIVKAYEPGLPKNILSWFQGCAGVITGSSNIAVEAMLIQVPVVTMDYTGILDEGISFIDEGATLHTQGFDELKSAVLDIVGDSERLKSLGKRADRFVEEMYYQMDGMASKRSAKGLLGEMLDP
jgi:glycosyltransferase involved in cell wall biosynthesis